MFGKKKDNPSLRSNTDNRIFNDAIGHVWLALTGRDPQQTIPQIIGTVVTAGGTRPAWRWKNKDQEFIVMAWPQDQPIRAAVLMNGKEGGRLDPISAFPLIEGLPQDLTVEETHQRPQGWGGDVAVSILEGKNPMWFFDPLYGRDQSDLTPGVTHTFWLGAIALHLRKALLDHVTVIQGPQFEAWTQEWLAKNPEKSKQDVPPLKIEIKDKHFIMPGQHYGEYHLRGIIDDIQDFQLERMPVKLLYLNFPFDSRPDMRLPLYASKFVLGDWIPEKGQEIEAYTWFQGRIIDLAEGGDQNNDTDK